MKVKSIYIYPIKGMAGTELSNCNVLVRGLENDRRYMLIDKANNFISQRSHAIISLIKPTVEHNIISIRYLSHQYDLSIGEDIKEEVKVSLFEHTLDATLVSPSADKWFSEILKEEVRLVKMTNSNIRHKKLIKGPKITEVSFADGYPILIAGTASLGLLNSKLGKPILMNRFRPNIVVETEVSHIEDEWEDVQIGTSNLMVIKPCARCPVVTIEQETANQGKEPLKTLSTYRRENNNVFFGANAICRKEGGIGIEDEVIPL